MMIGYPCPVVLDNGRPCSGAITRTHQKQPLNQKRKQKRVEAAAAAAAAKPKQAPAAAKAKEPKPPGVTAATPPRAAGVPVLSPQHAGLSLPQTNSQQDPGLGADPKSKLAGNAIGLAVQRNEAMAPERVVRQRVIPGWGGASGGKAAKTGSALEQQRALVAALKAEAKAAAGRGGTAARAAAAAAAPGAGGSHAASGGVHAAAGKAAGGVRVAFGRGMDEPIGADGGDWHSEDSGTQTAVRSGAASADGGSSTPSVQDFTLASEDFPAFKCPMPAPYGKPYDEPAVPPPALHAAQAGAAGEEGGAEAGAVVAYVPVYATEDGTVVVADEHGSFVRMEDVYGAAPELVGFMDEQGSLAYYVVIRGAADAGLGSAAAGGVEAAHSVADSVGSEPGASSRSSAGSPWCDGQRLTDQGPHSVPGGAGWLYGGAADGPCDLVTESLAAEGRQQQPQQQQQPGVGGGEDLDDLLALCVGAGGGSTPSAVLLGCGGAVQRADGPGAATLLRVDAAVTATVANREGSTADGQQQQQQLEGEDLGALLQLLCV